MRGALCGLGLVISLFGGAASAPCQPIFGGSYGQISIFEDGTFRIAVDPIDATAITAITIEDSLFGKYFNAAKNEAGDKWVLEVLPGLTDWYDAQEPGFDPDVPLTITYTCSANPNGWNNKQTITISGLNNRAPAFSQTSYESTITKLMPPDVPLHFVDTGLDIIASDEDFVCVDNCNNDDTSNNIVATCIVEGDEDNVIKCEAKKEDDSGKYRMFVSLTKSIDDMQATSYSFNLKAQDGGTPPLESDPVTVTLKFPEEDLNPPKFIQDFYSAPMITTKHQYPFDIIEVEAHDGDDAIAANILYSVVSSTPACADCFSFSGATLQQTKDLTQEMISARLVTVLVQATEDTQEGRSSVVVVNIPIAGDDNSPQLDPSFYSTTLSLEGENWTMDPIAPFIPSDADTMMNNNKFKFKLNGDFGVDVNSIFELTTPQGPQSTIKLKAGADIDSLPDDGEISFFIEVSDDNDPTKFSRSLITVNYPPTLQPTTTAASTEPGTTEACDCPTTISPTDCPAPTDCPETPTECPETPTDCPVTECPTEPCEFTTPTPCPEPDTTITPCDCTTPQTTPTEPTTTTKATPTSGEYVAFTSMDANEDTQYVGYPGFIPLQNSAPMPITKVKATAFGWCDSQIIYSMKQNNNFFIEQSSGEIFLVNNAGFGSIQTTCEQPCQLEVFADLSDLDVPQASLTVQVSSLSESQILVLDSNSSYTTADSVLSSINSATNVDGKYWFRLVHIQPKEEGARWQRTMVSTDKSVLFVTANKMDGKTFVDKEEASTIINEAAGADVGVDTTIQVNNQPQEETSGGGSNTAVIVLAVLLALVILAVLVAIFVIKRKFFLSLLPNKQKETGILESSTENSSVVAYKVEEQKPRRNSKGLFNLQSVTIQTSQPSSNPRGRPAVGASAQPGLMREMSTELEKRLESKAKPESSRAQHSSNTKPPVAKKSHAPNVPVAPKPTRPSQGGIKFNERAEVMEVEKTKRLSISSGTSDSSADSSSSGSSSSGDSAIQDDNEKVTRI